MVSFSVITVFFCFLLSPRIACLRFRLLLLGWLLVGRTFLVVRFFGVGVLAARLLVVSFAAVLFGLQLCARRLFASPFVLWPLLFPLASWPFGSLFGVWLFPFLLVSTKAGDLCSVARPLALHQISALEVYQLTKTKVNLYHVDK